MNLRKHSTGTKYFSDMSLEYDPHHSWFLPALAQFLKIRDNRGFHRIYKYGYVQPNNYEIALPDNIYNGWTARIFVYRTTKQPLVAMHIIASSSSYCKTEVYKGQGDVKTSQAGVGTPARVEDLGVTVKPGDVYSLGIRVKNDKFLVSVANTAASKAVELMALTPKSDKFNIWSGEDVILSLHLSEEEGNEYSPPRPRTFNLPKLFQPPGSTFLCTLESRLPSEDTKIGIDSEGDIYSAKWINYGKNVVPKNQQYFVYIRNLPDHWSVITSFNIEPKTLAHKAGTRNIFLHRPGNSYQISIVQHVNNDF